MAEQQIVPGHVLAGLAKLAPGSVHATCFSPPYYGLRAYSTTPQLWGGDGSCAEHVWGPEQVVQLRSNDDEDEAHGSTLQGAPRKGRITSLNQGAWCQRCGAWLGELGSEPTLAQYLANMVGIMRAVRRVLRPDGVAFVNIADSMSSGGPTVSSNRRPLDPSRGGRAFGDPSRGRGAVPDIPAKNLLLVPQRLVIAFQDDGWIVRSDIILTKNAPMPGSQRDRPTTAYEHLLMLTRQPHYWFDLDAVREPHKRLWDETNGGSWAHAVREDHPSGSSALSHRGGYPLPNPGGRTPHDWMPWEHRGSDYAHCLGCDAYYAGRHQVNRIPLVEGDDGRKLRKCPSCGEADQWADHYAAFPEFIPRFAINAACPDKTCPECGAGWVREVEKTSDVGRPRGIDPSQYRAHGGPQQGRIITSRHTIGWRPGCDHPHDEADTVPGTVLDPFVGSGTTLLVAREMGRNAIGLELSESYVRLAERRLGLAAVPLL